jgi:hypothetical protein
MNIDEMYEELLHILSEVGADINDESEQFLLRFLENFQGSKDDFLRFVEDNLYKWFKFIKYKPDWIQNAEWQFNNGKPMIFVGQVEVEPNNEYFHDEASFYFFWDSETGDVKNIIQVS